MHTCREWTRSRSAFRLNFCYGLAPVARVPASFLYSRTRGIRASLSFRTYFRLPGSCRSSPRTEAADASCARIPVRGRRRSFRQRGFDLFNFVFSSSFARRHIRLLVFRPAFPPLRVLCTAFSSSRASHRVRTHQFDAHVFLGGHVRACRSRRVTSNCVRPPPSSLAPFPGAFRGLQHAFHGLSSILSVPFVHIPFFLRLPFVSSFRLSRVRGGPPLPSLPSSFTHPGRSPRRNPSRSSFPGDTCRLREAPSRVPGPMRFNGSDPSPPLLPPCEVK